MTTNEWRRCPFCGSEVNEEEQVTTERNYGELWADNGDKGCVTIRCRKCDVVMYQHDNYDDNVPATPYAELKEQLRRKWNTRRRAARED